MAESIGAVLKLDGEKEYRTALSDITQAQKTLTSEMKLAAAQFDKNTDKEKANAQQKQLLTDKIDEQKQKIDVLNQAVETASSQYGDNSRQAQKWKQKLAEAETELIKMNDELDELSKNDAPKTFSEKMQDFSKSIKDASKKISNVGKKVGDVGSSITKHVTVPIAAVGTAAVVAFNEVDTGADTIIQKTGASGDALQSMTDSMNAIASEIPTDFETAGTAIGEVNTRFGVTGDQLEELSKQFIEFANLNDQDVSSAVDQVQKAMDAFGVSTDDAGAVLDLFNATGQDTGISMDSLESNLTSNATAFQALGMNITDATEFLGKMETSGVDTTTVLTGLSRVQKEAGENSTTMAAELQNALSSEQSAIDIFGSKAGPKLYESFANGTLAVEDFVGQEGSLTDTLGSVSDTFTATLDAPDQWTTTLNELKTAGADLAVSIMPALSDVISAVSDIVKAATEKWNSLSEGTQDLILKGIALAAVIGPLLQVGSGVIGTISTITSVVGSLAAIVNPVGLIITGVIAAVVLAVTHWGDITQWAGDVWDTVCSGVQTVGQGLGDFFGGLWDGITSGVSTAWDGISSTVTTAWTGIVDGAGGIWNGLTDFFSGLWDGIKSTASTSWDNISTTVTGAWDTVTGAVGSAWDGFTGFFSDMWDDIKSDADDGWLHGINKKIKDGWSDITDKVGSAWDGFTGFFSDMWNDIKKDADDGWIHGINKKIKKGWSDITDKVDTAWGGFTDFFSDTWDTIKKGAGDKWDSITSTITGAWDDITGGVDKAWDGFTDFFGDMWDDVKKGASEKWDTITSTITGAWDGITGALDGAWSGVRGFFSNLWDGIDQDAAADWGSKITDTLSGAWDTLSSKASETCSNIKGWFSGLWDKITGDSDEANTEVTEDITETTDTVETETANATAAVTEDVTAASDAIETESGTTAEAVTDDSATLQQAYTDAAQAALDSANSSVSAFDTLESDTEITLKSMAEGLQSQTQTFQNYANNMAAMSQLAAETTNPQLQSILDEIADMGIDGADYLQQLTDAAARNDGSLDAILAEYGNAQAAKENYAEAIAAMQTQTTTSTDSMAADFSDAAATIESETSSAMDSASTSLSDAGSSMTSDSDSTTTDVADDFVESWDSIDTKTSVVWGSVQAAVYHSLLEMRKDAGHFHDKFDAKIEDTWNVASSTSTEKLNQLTAIVDSKMNRMISSVQSAVAKIRSAVSGFSWSLPYLKMPHPWVRGAFSVNPPSVPSFGINWYKKAYDTAIEFTSPTILPTVSGYKGLGDGQGSEIVIGKHNLLNTFTEAVRKAGSGEMTINIQVNGSDGQSAQEIADYTIDRLKAEISRRRMSFA